jgi:AcrR family transcriptional regulator
MQSVADKDGQPTPTLPQLATARDELLERAFPQLKPLRNSPTPRDKVEQNQRARAHAAMIEIVGTWGYTDARMDDIALRAGVSKRTLYVQFETKERFFLRTYGLVLRLALQRVSAASRAESEWTRQLARGLEVFMAYVVEQPKAARLALVEALGAGPRALKAMEGASAQFERLIVSSFEASPEKVRVPSIVVKGIAGGISRVARQRLIDGRPEVLPELTDELLRWTLSYHSNAAELVPRAPKRHSSPRGYSVPWSRPLVTIKDDTDRMMASAAQLVARQGYGRVKLRSVVHDALVSRGAFLAAFPGGVEECFLSGYDRMGAEVAAYASEAAASEQEWHRAVHTALVALMWRVAIDPIFTRAAFVEVFAVGPAGQDHRTRLIQVFSDLLLHRAPAEHRPSELEAEAIVGAVWELAHHYAVNDAADRLPQVADYAAYLVLAPTLGARQAVACICGA